MCLAKLYHSLESVEPILEDIAYLRIDGDRVELDTLFGERKVLRGKVRQVDFVKSRVVVEEQR